MMLVLMFLERRLAYSEKTVASILVASTLAQVIGSGLILAPVYAGSLAQGGFISDVGIVVRGCGSAALLLGLGRYLCTVEPRKSALYIAAGYTVFGLAALLLSFASADVVAFASLVFPFLTCLCLLWSNEKVKFRFESARKVNLSIVRKLPHDLVMLLFLCVLMGVVVGIFVPPSADTSPGMYTFLWPVVYLLVLVTYSVWVFAFKHASVNELWPFLMLIIFSGLLFYSSFSAVDADFAASFLRATQKTLILFCWVFLTTAIYQYQLPCVLFFGLGNFAFIQLPSLISFLGRSSFPGLSVQQATMVDIAAIAIVGFILVAAVVLVLMRAKGKGAAQTAEPSGSDIPLAIRFVAQRYGLTSREEEIASYAMRGYTFSQIAKTLFISVDTVRSHSKNLYRKLGIHKKQELIKLVEKAARETSSEDGQDD